jgi:hypothetical protein
MATYDPLAILERANAHASNWQSALDRAIAQQTAANNTAFADGFARDRVFQLYPSELNRMQSGSVYQAKLADMQTRLLPDQEDAQRTAYRLNASQNGLALQESQWAYSPDNTTARRTVLDDRLQSPAAQLRAGAATYGVVDPRQREAAIQSVLAQSPDALSAQDAAAGPYAATQVGQVIDRLLTGEVAAADVELARLGLGRINAQPDGKLVLVDAQGRASMPLSAQEAAVVLQSRTGQPGTPLQAYGAAQTQAAQAAMLKRFEQQAELAKEDVKARNALRLEVLKAAADPMATPESRMQLEQLAQRYGLDLGGAGGTDAAQTGGVSPAVAQAAGVGQGAGMTGYAAASGIGPAPRPQRDSTQPSSPPATPAQTLDRARQTSAQTLQAMRRMVAERAERYASLKRLDLDLVREGPTADPARRRALRDARQRMLDELAQMDERLEEQEALLRQSTGQLQRATREMQTDNAYRTYRP